MPPLKPTAVTPAGPINSLQWNKDGSIFGGSGKLTFDPPTETLTIPKTVLAHNSTLGGDIEKAFEMRLNWNPSTPGGDYNGIFMELISNSPVDRNAICPVNLYVEDSGTGRVTESNGINLVMQSKALRPTGLRVNVHGNAGVNSALQRPGWFTCNPPSNARLEYGAAVTAEFRGGAGVSVGGGHALDALVDISSGGTFDEVSNVYAVLEGASRGRVERFSAFRLLGTDRSAGMTFGTVIGLELPDITLGDVLNRAILTGRGINELGDRLLLSVPAAAIADADMKNGQFTFDLDEAGRFLIKAKFSNGAVKTFAVN